VAPLAVRLGVAPAERRRGNPARRTELGLVVFGGLIVTAAYVLASIGTTARVPPHLAVFLVIVLGLGLLAHVATRLFAPDATPVLLPVVILLNGLGYVTLASIHEPAQYPPSLQAMWTAVGVGFYAVTLIVVRRSRDLDRYRYLLLVVAAFLMLAPLIPHFGYAVGAYDENVRLWVHIGPLSGQPVELAKILIVIFFASYFVEKRELLSIPTTRVGNRLVIDPRPLGPILVAWGFCMLVLAAERDVGFAVLVFMVFIAMLWMATGRGRYLVLGVVLFAIGVFVASHLFAQVGTRVADWLHPYAHVDQAGGSYQLLQGLYGLGSGGLIGTGLGFGHLSAIPLAGSDYVFAAFGTEWGLLGSTVIVAAYALLVGAGFRAAQTARSDFARLAAAGFTIVLGLQSFFIMAGIVRILPDTGLTLPFMAYGGSSLVANYILIGLLVRISDEGSRPAATAAATARRLDTAAPPVRDERAVGTGAA
jgi:cell division protein FtsW (lipid II flippase)